MTRSANLSKTTMPSSLYADPAVYELDKERVFYRPWQFVGHVRSLPAPGAFFTARIADEFPGLKEEVLTAKPGLAEMDLVFEDRIAHACNWKVSVENFSECYHCPAVHRYVVTNLFSAEDYRITIEGKLVRHSARRLQDRETHGDLQIWFLWPNLPIELFPIHRAVSIRHFAPRGPRDTTDAYLWYADPDLPADAVAEVVAMGKTYRETSGAEDAGLVASVQQGLESRAYDFGQLVITPSVTPHSEHGVAHLQALYRDAISR